MLPQNLSVGKSGLNDSVHICHLQQQGLDNQWKYAEGGAPFLPPSVANPAYTLSDQGQQLKVEKTGVHLKLQMAGNQYKLT